MGTRARCIKCGVEKWANTGKLKKIKEQLGISPRNWIRYHFVCNNCKKRSDGIKETIKNINESIQRFNDELRRLHSGLLTNPNVKDINGEFKRLATKKLIDLHIDQSTIFFIKYKTTIVGVSFMIPIVGKITLITLF